MKIQLITLITLALWLFAGCTPPEKYELVWSDEFDYEGLPNPDKWSYDTVGNAWGWGNNELQYYTSGKIENAEVTNGTLKIKAQKENFEKWEYTSARLITKEKGDWLYGRFEIRAKLPDGRGLWPAIWMLPTDWEYGGWPQSGEIDIMENVGFDPFTIVSSIHTADYNHKMHTERNNKITLEDNRDVFHVYGVEWDETSIKGFVDDSIYFVFEKEADNPNVWPFDKRFHLLLNIAVGGDWGGAQGIDENIFPATMEIDYVRVYQKNK
ncbi:MAG TPA: glycoside hydrolase family 16 protein [Prolixibacteraceae bacterium]|nr:glycoside hydrolase family 16 protein [Prolixibacteraceae bacterium]HPR60784.1 glycoside hydrolase family 16 protein [Prolixibacteraceae bacterium]